MKFIVSNLAIFYTIALSLRLSIAMMLSAAVALSSTLRTIRYVLKE